MSAYDNIADIDSRRGRENRAVMMRSVSLAAPIVCVVLGGALWLAMRDGGYEVEAHSPRQNLAHFDATDVCEMLPISQFGNPIDQTGHRVGSEMTIYLRAPEGRRPKTGDVLDIKYPKELQGQVRFTQATNNGYGGSGPLVWIGKNRTAELGMAIFDFTSSGSLQYRKGKVLLWGDCKKASELKS